MLLKKLEYLHLNQLISSELNSGEIGFIITGIKSLSETKVGDTICDASNPINEPLPGFKPSKPVVFCGLFPS